MPRRVLQSCRALVVVSLFVFLLVSLNLPVLAAGPAPVQNGADVVSGPRIWLQDSQPLPVQHVAVTLSNGQGIQVADPSTLAGLGQGQPVSLASGDLDADGFEDLVVGYRTPTGGFISIHRGNIDAFAPQSDASFQAIAHSNFASPFLLEAKTFSVPVSPDFIALGNFTGSGNKDLVVASKNGNTLYIFPADGKGNFSVPQTVSLPDSVSGLASGELGSSHTPVLAVGMSKSMAVYVSMPQGLTALASYPVAAPVSNILFADLSDPGWDLAFLSGGKIQILRSSTMQLTTVSLPVAVRAFALGSFIYDRSRSLQIALVAPDGSVQIAARNEFDPRGYTQEEFREIRQAKMNHQPPPAFFPLTSFPGKGWRVVEGFPGVASMGASQVPVILRTRISVHAADDVMVLSASSGQMALISHAGSQPGAQTFVPGQVSLRPYSGTPLTALSMRTNVDVRPGIIALHQGEIAPSLLNPIPDPTFTVNTTNDGVFPGACAAATANQCTLREAILEADGDTIMVPANATPYTLTIAKVANDCTGKFGALSIGGSPSGGDGKTVTIVGGGQNSTIIQAGTVAYNVGTANGVDMVMNVNEDLATANCPVTSASASLSNLTLQNGNNRGTHSNDGDGGCMEFDTGTNGTATLSLTNVTLQNCRTQQGGGGGLVIFNSVNPVAGGEVTISNSIIQGNSAVDTPSSGPGGGIAISNDGQMTMSNSQVLNNLATEVISGQNGQGGGIMIFEPAVVSGTANESFIHASTISGNKAAGFGGGIHNSADLAIDQGTVISNNTAGTTGGSTVAGQEGGGLYADTPTAGNCPTPVGSTCTTSLSAVAITGNTASGNGGGVSNGSGSASGSLTMSFSRLANNTTSGGSGSNLNNNHATATVTDNWWGTDNASSTINSITATTTFDPFIVLTHTSANNPIQINQSTTLTADMSKDNHGNGAVLSGNLGEITGLPITFDSTALGTLSGAGTSLNANAQATATFTAGTTASSFSGTLFGGAHANVDQEARPVDSFFITSATESSSTATITTAGAHGFSTGQKVQILGVGVSGYNTPANQFSTIASTPTANTFTYSPGTTGLAASSGGNVTSGIIILEPPSITKSFSPTTIQSTTFNSGAFSTITFSINNPNVIPIDASFTDNLPQNVGTHPGSLVVASTPGVTNTCTGGTVTATAGANTISFSNPSLAAGTCSITVNVSSAVDNVYSNSVTIDSTAAGNGNTTPSANLTVINPPHISKAFGQSSIVFGTGTSLTITVANSNNVNETLSGITFTDTLPTNAPGTLVVATPSGLSDTCSGGATASPGSGSVSLAASSLPAGASCTVAVNVQGTQAGAANNSVTVSDATAGTGNTGTASETVTAATTSTAVASSSNPSVFGQSVTFTATVTNTSAGSTGAPTGSVQFVVDGSNFGSPVALTGASATSSTASVATATLTTTVAAPTHTVTANYVNADGNYINSSGSLSGGQTVNKADTTTTITTSSVDPSVFGQQVTFTATVVPVAPGAGTITGVVIFFDGSLSSPITCNQSGAVSSGVSHCTVSSLSVGTHSILARYSGDANFNNSLSTGFAQTVNKADTSQTVTSSANPQTAGQPVTFTATVSAVAPGSGTPTGTVEFLDNGNPIGDCGGASGATLSSGVATCTTSTLTPGNHTITTSYSGDGNFNTSLGALNTNPQVITQAATTTTVTSSAGTITLGDTVTFTATVTAASGTATGLVTFFDGNTPLGSGTLNGGGSDQATITTSLLSAAGSPHSITATYQGATAFAASTSSPISETVNERTSTTGVVLNPTTVVVGQSSTATVTVTDSGSVPPGTADTFTTTGAPATGRTGFTSTLFADGLVLVAGGTDANNNVLNSAEIYSVSNGTFSSTGNLNTARTGAVAVLLPTGKVLIAGGSSNGLATGALNTAELFDPSAGTFAVAGSGSSNTMTAARFGTTATLLNTGKVLIAGGVNSGGVLNSAELYDPTTDTFTATGNLSSARAGASATLLGTGKVLVAGGSSTGTATGALNSAEVFDPAGNAGAGTFTSVAGANPTLATGRWQPEAALLLSGKVLVTGGQNSGGALTSADLYDPVADSFTPSSQSMSQARANGSAVSLPSGMVLLAGGTTSQAVDLYDGDSDRFDTTGSLQQSDAGLVSTLLNNGQVLVVGLTTAATPASDAERYAPSFNPLGTVTFSSSENTDSFGSACVLTPSTSTASTCTSTVTPSNVAASPHTITATYPADLVHATSNNTASLTVNKADTTTTITASSANPSVFGQQVTFTATVTPNAPGAGTITGVVIFFDGSLSSPITCNQSTAVSSGVAHCTVSSLSVGSHTILARYSGDANFNVSLSTGFSQTVNTDNTTTTITANTPNPSVAGGAVSITASVTANAPGSGTPTGTVLVSDGVGQTCTITLTAGAGSCSLTPVAAGTDTLTATYSGDGNFNGSTSNGVSQTVNKDNTTTTITANTPNPSVVGQPVSVSASVTANAPGSGTPTGTVLVSDGVGQTCTITLTAGTGSCSLTPVAAGTDTLTATYSGDGNFNGSTSNGVSQTVNKDTTTTTITANTPNPSVVGQPVSVSASVTANAPGSGTPTGTVLVSDGVGQTCTITLTAGTGSCSLTPVAAGTDTLTAAYGGDGNFNGSTSNGVSQTVTAAITATAVISSSNPSVFGQSVTFTAQVTDASTGSIAQPTGSVQFVVDGLPFGSPVTLTGASSNSSAATSQATTNLSIAGSPHSVTANYTNADGNFINSTGSLPGGQVVTQANTTTTVTSSAGTITLGDTVTFTATVAANSPGTGTPTGSVTFFDGSTPIGVGTLNNGSPDQATFSTSLLAVGSDSITAVYNGDANFTASPLSSPTTETVNLRATTTSVALNPTTVGAGGASTITTTVTDGGASTPPGTPDIFTTTGAPATARTGFTSTLFADGLVLVAGGTGSDGTTVLNSAEIYSVSAGTFSTTGNLNAARTGAVAVLLPNGKVLIAGGSSSATAVVALQTAELFDPVAGTFTNTSHNMTAARFGATATLLNTGKVLIAGGQNSGVLNSAELYDPATDTFTATGNLNTARTGASATLLGTGKVLVAGGSSDGTAVGALNTAELFDPTGNSNAGTFTAITSTLSDLRWQPEAALLLSGKVLVAGGQNSVSGVLTSADIYDPVANSFVASANQMNAPHVNGSAVALPNGMVLLPGGTTRQTVDLYDVDSDKFNMTGSLLHSDVGLVATQLNNGRVLVVGINTDNAPTLVSDAELYSPTFNPLGTVGFSSSEPTDVFGSACVLTPSTSTASSCTSTVTPEQVATSPHTITGTYPADAVHSGSSNTASLTVIPTAPPTIAKAFSAQNVAQNGTVNVSFTIVNPNPAATLTGISFTDALPAGLVVATPNNLSSNCGGTFTAVSGSSSVSLTGGTLAPPGPPPQITRRLGARVQRSPSAPAASGQCVITLDLLVTGTGTISNTTGPISANESGPGNPSNTATIQVVLAPTANKAFGAATIPVNGSTSLTFNIANPNTATALSGIALTDTLPSGLVVATPNGATGSCLTVAGPVTTAGTLTAVAASGSVSLSGLALNSTGSCSFSINVTGTSGGTKNNTTAPITGTFDDGSGLFRVATGGTASASITVVAPPVISKAFAPPAIAPGSVSTLTFTLTNPAANTVGENGVAFTDTLPANLVVATPNGATGNCNGGTLTAVAGSSSISLTGGTIPAAGSCIVSVNVTSSVAGNYNNTTGAVSSTNGGTGNTASATLTIANASLSITKTHTGNFPRGSTGNNYTITVSDSATAGPTVGTVTVTDTLPNSNKPMVPTAMTGTGWTCTLNTLTCTRSDSLAPGASYPPITLTVTVPKDIQANVTNSATVSGGGDPNSHTANDPTHIGPPIEVTLAINNVTVNVGGTQFVNFTVDSSPGEGTINFACSGLPFGMSCSFNPPSTNQLSTTVTMGITASAGSGSLLPSAPGRTPPPLYAVALPLLGLIGLGGTVVLGRRRKVVRFRLGLAFGALALLLFLIGCGGGSGPGIPPTPMGTFQVTVTATSATTGDSGSAVVSVTVPQ